MGWTRISLNGNCRSDDCLPLPQQAANTQSLEVLEAMGATAVSLRASLPLIDGIVAGKAFNPQVAWAALQTQFSDLQRVLLTEHRHLLPALDVRVRDDCPLRHTLDSTIKHARQRRKKWLDIYPALEALMDRNRTEWDTAGASDFEHVVTQLPALKWHLTNLRTVVLPLARFHLENTDLVVVENGWNALGKAQQQRQLRETRVV